MKAGSSRLFEMLRRGFYLARRGMLALSLEIGGRECEACAAVEDLLPHIDPCCLRFEMSRPVSALSIQ